MPLEPLAPDPPKKRRRPALACIQCRRRKIRCDQERPCNNCTKSRIADCTFPETFTPSSWAGSTVRRGSQTPSLAPRAPQPTTSHTPRHTPPSRDEGRYQARALGSQRGGRSISSVTTSPAVSAPNSILSPNGPDVNALLAKVSELEKTISTLSRAENNRDDYAQDVDPSALSSGVKPPGLRFAHQSSWMNSTSLYSKVLRALIQARAETSRLSQSFASCKMLGDHIDEQLSVTTAPVGAGSRMPERDFADQLLEGYFGVFEGWLRVLHIPTFTAEYEKYWQRRDAVSDLFVLQLQVCLALGSVVHPDSLLWRNAASQWLLEARTWLDGASRATKKQATLEELQLACLVLIAEVNDLGSDHMHPCWVDAGNLVRKAMCMGLHRDPIYLGIKTLRQAEIRRRLWVTILELNLLLSLHAGQPSLVSDSDYDTRPPANLKDKEFVEEEGARRHLTNEFGNPTETTIQLALFDSFKLRSEIVTKVNSIGRANMSYKEVLRLHSELSKAKRRMQQRFAELARLQSGDAAALHKTPQAVLAEILLARYSLALHLPVLGPSIKDPAFHFSRRYCVATSIEMARAGGILPPGQHNGTVSSDSWVPALHRLFVNSPGVFRHIVIQAVFAITLELVTSREEEFENQGAFPVWDVAELAQHVESAHDWAGKRLQAGLTDIRPYCFLAACLSYAASLHESGTPVEDVHRAMAEAAAASGEGGREMLNGVAEKLGVTLDDLVTPGPDNLQASLKVTDFPLDWVGEFPGDGMDSFTFGWTYPADPCLESAADMNLGLMAL